MGWGYGLGLWSAPASPPCWLHQRPWSSHVFEVLVPISLPGSKIQLWRSPTFHESTSHACLPWPSQNWLAGLRSHEGTGTTTHNQRIPISQPERRPHTVQYGVPPAATSALHNLSGLMKAICRDSSTHLPSDRVLKAESNYETEGEKRTSYNASCGCFDICKPAHVRASRVGMIKSRNGQECWGTLRFVCQLWAAGSNWRQFDDFLFDTHRCKRFRLLKRLFEGSRAYRLEFLHSFDCRTCQSQIWSCFRAGRIRVHLALVEVVMKIDCCK